MIEQTTKKTERTKYIWLNYYVANGYVILAGKI